MVLMNGSKAARNAVSITNNTKNYGIMGGTGPKIGKLSQGCSSTRNTNCIKIPFDAVLGLAYMRANNLLSVNPASSGGVGKRVTMVYY